MKVVIYARYSSDKQNENSIIGQEKICREYAQREKLTIIGEYVDRAITGKHDNRPELQRMLTDSKQRTFQAVLVYSLDRMGRNVLHSLQNEQTLQKNGVEVISATEPMANTPSGRFMRIIQMGNAQYYSEELALKIKRGVSLLADKCLFTGGAVALGYKVNADRSFSIDSNTAFYVQKIFEKYANGETVANIYTYLNANSVTTLRGGKFNKNSLHKLLKNKRYIGVYTFKGKEFADKMPRIISDELFAKVQRVMEKNKSMPARKRAKEEYILTPKLFCGHCLSLMVGYGGTSRTKQRKYHYYSCAKSRITDKETGKKLCRKKPVSKQWIENIVCEKCKKFLTDENIEIIIYELMAVYEKDKDKLGIKEIEKQITNTERKIAITTKAVTECEIELVRKNFYIELNELCTLKLELEKQLAIENHKWQAPMTADEIKPFFKSLQKGDINDIKTRKALIDVFLNRVYLFDDKLRFIFNAGSKQVEITEKLLDEIDKGLYNKADVSSYNDNLTPPAKSLQFKSCKLFA